MNSQEREVISDIFRRLEQVANQPRDPEAERFIAEKLRQQPYAPYAMAQAIHVQEQALTNLHAQVQQLEAELERLQNEPRQSGGIFGSLFGGGSREPEPRRPVGGGFGGPQYGGPQREAGQWGGGQPGMGGGQQPGPWGGGGAGMTGGQPGAFGAAQRGGSGFLGTAMMTAAGVAGGMMLGNALTSAFGGGQGGQGGQGLFGGGQQGSQANAGGDQSDLSPFQNSGDAGLQDASYEPNEDFGGDFGGDAGGDDWA
jgi:uncharacterized protein